MNPMTVWSERPGCPRCRAKLVRHLRGERFAVPDFPAPLPVRHFVGVDIPVWVLVVGTAAALLSAGVGAYASYSSSQAQAAGLEYNAAIAAQQAAYQQQLGEFQATLLARQAAGSLTLAEAEAAISEQQAVAAAEAGELRAAGIRRAYERTQSEVRAAIGKSGVDTTGSPLMALIENADTVGQELAVNEYQTALDVAGAKAGAAYSRTERALRAQSLMGEAGYARFGGSAAASAALAQGNLLRFQAGGARQAGMFNVGTTLLGGIGAAASPYLNLRYGSAGGFPGYKYGTA